MDALDQQLIALLRTNARLSIAALAHKLKVSRGTVNNRIEKLENDGIIVGYTVRWRPLTHNRMRSELGSASRSKATKPAP